ncbi:MAG: hypothetical protein JEY71_10965 [Sphaerochaeta sp.]|nr:hypothetical protein [Sphaerochaeta sp.]
MHFKREVNFTILQAFGTGKKLHKEALPDFWIPFASKSLIQLIFFL